MKDSTNARKTFKVNVHKQPYLHKHLKTEPDELPRKLTVQSGSNPQNKYQVDGVAGKGTFGTVYRAIKNDDTKFEVRVRVGRIGRGGVGRCAMTSGIS